MKSPDEVVVNEELGTKFTPVLCSVSLLHLRIYPQQHERLEQPPLEFHGSLSLQLHERTCCTLEYEEFDFRLIIPDPCFAVEKVKT